MPNIESERFLKARVMLQIICNFFSALCMLSNKATFEIMTHIVKCWPKITLQKHIFFPLAILFWVRHFHGKFDTFSALLNDDVVSVTFTWSFLLKRPFIFCQNHPFFQIWFQSYCFTQALFHFGSYLVKKTSSSISRKKEVFKADSEQVLTWLGVLVHYWWKDLFELATTFTTWNRSTVHC